MSKLDIYNKLLKIQPWYQRSETPVMGGSRARAYRTYRKAILTSVDGGAVFVERTETDHTGDRSIYIIDEPSH